jgi:cobalt/nickel transport system permease protein
MRRGINSKRIFGASMTSAVIGLQMGAFSVVLQTLFSGKTGLPFKEFVLCMQPVHLAIGVVEGLVTAAVVTFVWRARPEILEKTAVGEALGNISVKKVLAVFVAVAIIAGGFLSWFASANPDGLEWSIFKTAGKTEIEASGGVHKTLEGVQEKTSILSDYSFKADKNNEKGDIKEEKAWSNVNVQTSVSGIVGGSLTLALAVFTGIIISIVKGRKRRADI